MAAVLKLIKQDRNSKNVQSSKDEVIKMVRATLLSQIGGVTLQQFQTDYCSLACKPLDFQGMGYASIMEFLKAIPHVVRLEHADDVANCRLFGIVDPDKYAHSPMIKAQLSSVKPASHRKNRQKNGRGGHGNMTHQNGRNQGGGRSPLDISLSQLSVADYSSYTDNEYDGDISEGPLNMNMRAANLVPNMKGLYAVCFRKDGPVTREVINDDFSTVGDIEEISYTKMFVFVRFKTKKEAVKALEKFGAKYKLIVPEERMNPRQLVKGTEISRKPDSNNMFIVTPERDKVYDVYVGNLPIGFTKDDFMKLFKDFKVADCRINNQPEKSFGFLVCKSVKDAEDIIEKMHRWEVKGKTIVVQRAYDQTESSAQNHIGGTAAASLNPTGAILENYVQNNLDKPDNRHVYANNPRQPFNLMVNVPGLVPVPFTQHGASLLGDPLSPLAQPRCPYPPAGVHMVPDSQLGNLFFANFPFNTSVDEMAQLFQPFGLVKINIGNNIDTSKSTYGFVTLHSLGAAAECISKLNDKDFKGRKLCVKWTRNQKENEHRVGEDGDHGQLSKPRQISTNHSPHHDHRQRNTERLQGYDQKQHKANIGAVHKDKITHPPQRHEKPNADAMQVDKNEPASVSVQEVVLASSAALQIPAMMNKDFLKELMSSFGQNLLTAKQLPEKTELIVTHVENDHFFWAHVRSFLEELIKLKLVMDMLQRTELHQTLPKGVHKCAAVYYGEWYRGWIIDRLPDNKVEVFFIDYGNTSVVPATELVGLSEACWELKPMCVPFRLKGAAPDGKTAVDILEKLVTVKPESSSEDHILPVSYLCQQEEKK